MDTIEDYLKEGYDVVYNYIISPEDLQRIQDAFHDVNMKFVVLLIDKDTLLQRDALRPEDCQMKERCIELLHEFMEYHYEERFIIDTGKLSVEESARNIIEEERFDVLK